MRLRSRNNKIKIQHSIIEGLLRLLETISKEPEVVAIVPGRIKPVAGHYKLTLEYTAPTDSGLKFIAKSNRAVQEVFIAILGTTDQERFLARIREIIGK